MRRITSFEIRCLKELLKIYRARIFQREQQIINLELENDELRKQLEESRAKEGKGALEKLMASVTDAFASLNFTSMVSAQIESAHCNILDADCIDDCDFDCEHCERAKLDKEATNDIREDGTFIKIEISNARLKGKWRVYEGVITCEKCGKEAEKISPFCAWCGADMREEASNDE